MLKYNSTYIYVSLQSYNLNTFIVPFTNSDCNIAKNVRTGYDVGIIYFFLGIGICLGGLSTNDFSNWCITSDKGRSCSSISLSSSFLTSSVVLNEINSDFDCLIRYIMLDKYLLINNVYIIKFCKTFNDIMI